MDDLLSQKETLDKLNSLDEPEEYIVLKGKAALIAKILLDISGKDDNSE